ncbi:MAG TPA: hypothetical protein VFY87_20060 [Geminicoccaceae bacterium]|nr:hypothetical protein [Geminicoccaceae bacterium]
MPGFVPLLPLLAAACAADGSAPARDLSAARAPTTAVTTRSAPLPRSGVHLAGLGGGELEGLLGPPTLVRSEQDAQYWRYSLGSCQLDLFLYADPGGGPSRVAYFDVRPSRHAPPGRVGACADLGRALGGGRLPPATVDARAGTLVDLPVAQGH